MSSLALVWDLIARDNASGAFLRVGEAAEVAGTKTEAASAKIATAATRVAKAGALAGVALAGISVKMAADFQQQTNILVTAAGESAGALESVRKGILSIAQETGTNWRDLTDGMYQVEKAGYRGAEGLKILKAAAQAAREEGANLATVTNATTSVMASYRLTAEDSVSVTNQLKAAAGEAKTTMELFSGSLSTVLPVASANKISFADVAGSLASLTQHGTTADEAAQELAFTIRGLAAPNNVAVQTMNQLGISSTDVALKLGDGPGGRGLAGTLKYLSETVLSHLGPSGLVLLDAFKQSTTAADDMQRMLSVMPPKVKALSEQFASGSITVAEYRKAYKDLPTDQASMAQQFSALAGRANGFNDQLRRGGPAAATFSDQMKRITGGANGLNTVLQLTGESMAGTEERIRRISDAGKNAGENVAGWESTQKLFNVQLDRFVQTLAAGAINLGQHLLPALTSAMSWMTDTGIPAVAGFGSAIGDMVKWFSDLPTPIRDVALAFAALKLAMRFNFLGISSGVAAMKASFAGFREEMALQQSLYAMNQRSAAALGAEYGVLATRLEGVAVAAGTANTGLSRLSAGGAVLAARGMAGLKAAGSGLLAMFGGPWGVALIGAAVGIGFLTEAIKRHDEAVAADTAKVAEWQKAINFGTEDAGKAEQGLAAMRAEIDRNQTAIDAYNKAAESGVARGGIGTLVARNKELNQELTDGTRKWREQLAQMTPVQEAQGRVEAATYRLNMALKSGNSKEIAHDQDILAFAQQNLANWTQNAAEAAKTQNQRLQETADKALAASDAVLGAQLSQMQLDDAIAQYNKDAADGQHTSQQLAEEQLQLARQAQQVAQAAGDAAAAQAKQNGITDTATVSQYAMLQSLRASAEHLTGPGKQAILDSIKALEASTATTDGFRQTVQTMGGQFVSTWKNNGVVLSGVTADEIKDLSDLGFKVTHLPNGNVTVTADTRPGQQQIDNFIAGVQHRVVTVFGSVGSGGTSSPLQSVGGGLVANAAGNVLSPMPGGQATVVPPNTWRIVGDNMRSPEAYIPLDGSARSQSLLTIAAKAMGRAIAPMALGGVIPYRGSGNFAHWAMPQVETIPVHMQMKQTVDQVANWMLSRLGAAFGVGSYSGGGGSMRALGQAIANAMGYGAQFSAIDYIFTHESGWNPLAQNPTSSAFGIPQFLDATWAAYGGKTTDPSRQIRDGILYMINRYGSPNGAAAFWARNHWYDNGGYLPPGISLAINGTGKPERVRTAEQEAALQGNGPLDLSDRTIDRLAVAMVQGAGAAISASARRGDINSRSISRGY